MYLTLLALTCLLESSVYWFFLFHQLTKKRILLAVLLVNLATHPLVTWGFSAFFRCWQRPNKDYLLASELFAFLLEGWILGKGFGVPLKRAAAASVSANLVGLYVAVWA